VTPDERTVRRADDSTSAPCYRGNNSRARRIRVACRLLPVAWYLSSAPYGPYSCCSLRRATINVRPFGTVLDVVLSLPCAARPPQYRCFFPARLICRHFRLVSQTAYALRDKHYSTIFNLSSHDLRELPHARCQHSSTHCTRTPAFPARHTAAFPATREALPLARLPLPHARMVAASCATHLSRTHPTSLAARTIATSRFLSRTTPRLCYLLLRKQRTRWFRHRSFFTYACVVFATLQPRILADLFSSFILSRVNIWWRTTLPNRQKKKF